MTNYVVPIALGLLVFILCVLIIAGIVVLVSCTENDEWDRYYGYSYRYPANAAVAAPPAVKKADDASSEGTNVATSAPVTTTQITSSATVPVATATVPYASYYPYRYSGFGYPYGAMGGYPYSGFGYPYHGMGGYPYYGGFGYPYYGGYSYGCYDPCYYGGGLFNDCCWW